MILRGFTQQSLGQAVKFVKDDLDFDNADSDVSVFELTIRGLAP